MGGQKIENSQKYNMVCDVDCSAASVGYSEKAFNPSCIEIGSLRALDFIIWVNGYESMNASGRLFP